MSHHHDTLDAFLVGAAMQASYNYSKLQRTERIRLLAQLKQTQLDPDLQRRVEALLQREIVVAKRQGVLENSGTPYEGSFCSPSAQLFFSPFSLPAAAVPVRQHRFNIKQPRQL